jgi:hypothetical protein
VPPTSDLLYLHRSFFARAVTDHPKDPLGSPYGTSVIAAYRSAGSLVALMRNLHTQLKEPSERIWFLWGHLFSCAVCIWTLSANGVNSHTLFIDCTRVCGNQMSIYEFSPFSAGAIGFCL